MDGGIGAAGDLLTGAVVGRAVEPRRGRAGHGAAAECLNCGAALAGPYCHCCGQEGHVHRTLIALWHDIAHGVFHFDGKVWSTIPLLAWRPGDLTRRYIHGERARFVSPLALFLFCVFLMFAVFESVGGPFQPTVKQNGVTIDTASLRTELTKAKDKVALLQHRREAALRSHADTSKLDEALDDARDDVAGLNAATTMTGSFRSNDLPSALPSGVHVDLGSRRLDAQVNEALKNPKLLIYKLQSSAYKFSWALIPLSLPFMWAMFAWCRQYKPYDHAVFVTYSISAVMLLLIAMALVRSIGVPTGTALLLVPVHFFRQLQQAYRLSVFSALWRTFALLLVAFVTLTLFSIVLLVLGLSH